MRRVLVATALIQGLAQSALARPGPPAPPERPLITTPPMGFNNWARFECNLNESLFTQTADAMLANGLQKAGYTQLNLDDCWLLHNRTADGELAWDPEKFPHGIPWLVDYVRKRGFNLGIYEDAGTETCGGYPGSFGYEEIDGKTFASWGINYLKLDACNIDTVNGSTMEESYKAIYRRWHEVLSAMSKPLIFAQSAASHFDKVPDLGPYYTVLKWVRQYGQVARHGDDIATYGEGQTWDSIMENYNEELALARYQKVGFYNDPDMILPDYPDISIDEKRSHFALWASFSAPLLISAYVPDLTDAEVSYLTNADLIAVNQDALCLQATIVSKDGTWDVLTKNLANGDRLVTVLNHANKTGSTTVPMERLGLSSGPGTMYKAKDLWTGATKQVSSSKLDVSNVPGHGTAVFRLSRHSGPKSAAIPTGMLWNTVSGGCMQGSDAPSVNNATCNGADSQVWQVRDDGSIRSLASGSHCLTAGPKDGSAVSMAKCQGGQKSQQWTYSVSGNVINGATGACLAETGGGPLVTEKCGDEVNEQVFALPSGVEVHEE